MINYVDKLSPVNRYPNMTRKNDAFVAKIENTLLTKIFMAIFAPDERLPSSATLAKYMTELYCSKQSCLLLVVILYGFTQERYFTDTTTTQRITTTLGRGMRILFRLNCHNKKITYLSFLFFFALLKMYKTNGYVAML